MDGEWPNDPGHSSAANFFESQKDSAVDVVANSQSKDGTPPIDAADTVPPQDLLVNDQLDSTVLSSAQANLVADMDNPTLEDHSVPRALSIDETADAPPVSWPEAEDARQQVQQNSETSASGTLSFAEQQKESVAALDELDSWAAPQQDRDLIEPDIPEPDLTISEALERTSLEANPEPFSASVDQVLDTGKTVEDTWSSAQAVRSFEPVESTATHQYTTSFARTAESVHLGEAGPHDAESDISTNAALGIEAAGGEHQFDTVTRSFFDGDDSTARLEADNWTGAMGGSNTDDVPMGKSSSPMNDTLDGLMRSDELLVQEDSNVSLPEQEDDLSWMGVEPKEELEDSWAAALGSSEQDVDASWETFLEDEGFLEDESLDTPATTFQSEQQYATPVPTTSVAPTLQPSVKQLPTSSYDATSPIRDIPQSQQNVGPMKFFEELPTSQPIRSRRPKQQVVSHTPTPPPAPPSVPAAPDSGNTPPRQVSGALPQNQYSQFRPPERLDPFPPQPTTVPSTSTPAQQSQPVGARYSQPVSKPPGSVTSRYSPATTQPVSQPLMAPNQPPTAPQRQSSLSMQQSGPPLAAPAKDVPQPPPTSRTKSPYATRPTSQGSRGVTYTQAPPQAPPQTQPAAAPPQRPTGPGEARTIAADRYSPPPPGPTSMSPPAPPPPNLFAPRTSSPLSQVESYSREGPPMQTLSQPEPVLPPQARPSSRTARYSPSVNSTNQQQAVSGAEKFATMSPVGQVRPEPPPSSSADQFRRQIPSPPIPKTTVNRSVSAVATVSTTQPTLHVHSRIHQAPQIDDSQFVFPDDETAQDPLQRWKGRPILQWGSSGMLSTCFPKQIPRYGGGQAAPMMKCVPGEVKVQKVRDLLPDATLVSFPGPLKSKNKKKDVGTWLSSKIDALQHELQNHAIDAPSDTWSHVRLKEKIILWELIRLLVEHDGSLTGNTSVESAVRWILSPNLEAVSMKRGDQGHSVGNTVNPESASAATHASIIPSIRHSLLRGERENAVWHAVDNRMWTHAMLISSTMGGNIWKQVVQEFVRKEVRAPGQENQSLAALYEIFAGNWDESVDELVPASARAGLQMVSTTEGPGNSSNALDGLNKWRETLGLILSNRSAGDESAIFSLGKLLAGYGRVEAAHVCFLFCRSLCQFGGVDDPNANFTLLGADLRFASEASHDLDSILLTEVYEFALSLPTSATAYYIPHLQAYKLYHAYNITESGNRAEALQYCEAIGTAMKSSTRSSPYYHATLLAHLDDLAKRLSQSPKDGASGWMSKPSIEKVSGSMWARFNSFVAGDDTETASNASGGDQQPEVGPFAHMGGDVTTISRSASSADIYGGAEMMRVSSSPLVNSRYAPASQVAPQPNAQPRRQYTPSYPSSYQPSPEFAPATLGSKPSMDSMQSGFNSPSLGSPFVQRSSNLSQTQSYKPQGVSGRELSQTQSAPSYEPYMPSVIDEQQATIAEEYSSQLPPQQQYLPEDLSQGVTGLSSEDTDDAAAAVENNEQDFNPGMNGYASSYGGYDPMATSSYAPPETSYQPYEPDANVDDETPVETKRRGIMDDNADDELSSRAAELKKREKQQRDKEADDAFKQAAEADANRDKDKRNSSWFGGWFGGKKDPNGPTVHKAKLGEENSFYYDNETKKWVNKKAGATPPPTSAATPPPPPKGLGSSASLGSMTSGAPPPQTRPPPSSFPTPNIGPPSGPPSRGATPARTDSPSAGTDGGSEVPPTSVGPPTSGVGPPTAPPSRPATAMSDASSIEDLIGGPTARKGGTVKKGKKGQRYVDVMAK